MTVITEIATERQRQISVEGYDAGHDEQHENGELAAAAAAYALLQNDGLNNVYVGRTPIADYLWPWNPYGFSSKGDRRNLVCAAALIIAEIERLDEVARRCDPDPSGDATSGSGTDD